MADNVTFQKTELATPASGTKVSTDEAASGHLQRVKLAYSADGVDTHIPADGSGLLVNTGAHVDDVHDSMALTDQAIAVKAAIFGHNSGGAGSYEPVKVTPSGALTVEIDDGGGSITVDGTVAATQSGTWNVGITGNVALPAGASTEYSLAQLGSNLVAVTTGSNLRVLGLVDARQSGAWQVGVNGTVPVTDNGGSLTVDGSVGITGTATVAGTVAATQSGTWNVGITGGVSLPTGAATEYSLGLLGSNLVTVTNGSNLRVGGFVDARQTGAWNVGIAGSVPVTDNGGSLTVDGTVAATQSGAWTVTANAGTGPFPVSDNGGSLTVDGTVGVSGTVTVDGSGVTQPVSGTVTVQDGGNTITVDNGGTFAVQAAQSGTWTVQPGNTANTTAWKVDASSVAVPVTDNSGSLTVDAPVATPVFVRLSDGSAAITTLPVSLASVPSHAVTNAGTFAVQAAQSGTWNINNVGGTISLPTGAATETSVAAVAATASGSNLRISQVNPDAIRSALAAVGTVTSSASNVTLMAANASRKGFAIFNDSTAICYVKFGTTASTTSFTVRVDAYGFYESGPTVYGGQVDAIWASANGAARVTEW